jgi:hypothetical protein
MRRAAILLVLAGCDPVWQLTARVTGPDRAPLADATLAITCPASSVRGVYEHAATTDAQGSARIGGLWYLPAGCTVTVMAPGRASYTTTFEAMCVPRAVDDCDRIRQVDVVLAPE